MIGLPSPDAQWYSHRAAAQWFVHKAAAQWFVHTTADEECKKKILLRKTHTFNKWLNKLNKPLFI